MPNILIHILADAILFSFIYWYHTKIKKLRDFKKSFVAVQIIGSNLIDIDHLLANPIYDPNRCSITTHPLHSFYAMPIYIVGSFIKTYRYFFWAVLLHLVLDGIWCLL